MSLTGIGEFSSLVCLFVLLLQCASESTRPVSKPVSFISTPFCSSYFFTPLIIYIALLQFSPTIRWAAVIPATQPREESIQRADAVSSLS